MASLSLIGAADFVGPRHLRAIKDTGNTSVVALDPDDNVGVIDSDSPDADPSSLPECIDRHLNKLHLEGRGVDFVSIYSPNFLHDAHIRMALRNGAHAICEKSIVPNPWNADALMAIERETGRRVSAILQLRNHPRDRVAARASLPGWRPCRRRGRCHVTSRGKWYHRSWKGNLEKSGGIVTNVCIHFFDMLAWIFGPMRSLAVQHWQGDYATGLLELDRARIRWFLSVKCEHLPEAQRAKGQRTCRSITMDGAEVEFSDGSADLQTVSHREILAGRGYGFADARPSIEMVQRIRRAPLAALRGGHHPICAQVEVPYL